MNQIWGKLTTLSQSQNWEELEEYLIKIDDNANDAIKKYLFKPDGYVYLDTMLKALKCRTRESTELKVKIYKSVLPMLKSNEDTDEKVNSRLITSLVVHFNNIPSNCYADLVSTFVQHFKRDLPFYGSWTELLGHIITLCSKNDGETAMYQEGGGDSAKVPLRQALLRVIFDGDWDPRTASTILTIFKDANLNAEEQEATLAKMKKVMNEVEIRSVPPIAYNLLRLWSAFDSFGPILSLFMDYFNAMDALHETAPQSSEGFDDVSNADCADKSADLIQAKATVILHVTDMAQFQWQIIKDFLKVLRVTWLPDKLFTPFNLALALSFTRNPRFKDQIIECLKSCVLKHFRTEERKRASLWLSELCDAQSNLRQTFRTTVYNCKGGWDQVNDGMVHLCFSLLESGSGIKKDTWVSQKVVSLASSILPAVFKQEPRLAPDILRTLSTQFLAASSASQYVDVLGRLVKSSPMNLLDNLPIVKEMLEVLSYLPLSSSESLLVALLPLVKANSSLKDDLIIILRKMLFAKNVENRLTAVVGFCELLKNLRLVGHLPSSQASMSFSSAMSQVSADVHVGGRPGHNNSSEAVCLEVLGVLRRVLMQQAEVRSTLYEGLRDASKANPKLIPSILQFLLQHVKQFIDLEPCLLNPVLHKKAITFQGDIPVCAEPLPELLMAISRISFILKSKEERSEGLWDDDDDVDTSDLLTKCDKIFDDLSEKMAYCDVEDLNLTEMGSSKHTSILGDLFCGVLDALVEHLVRNDGLDSENQTKLVVALFRTRKRLLTYVKEKTTVSSKKGESTKSKDKATGHRGVDKHSAYKSSTNISVCTGLLRCSLLSEDVLNDEGNCIQGNVDIQEFAMQIIDQCCSKIKSLDFKKRQRYLKEFITCTKLLMKYCINHLTLEKDELDSREAALFSQYLCTIHSLFAVFVKYYQDKLPLVLRDILEKSPTTRLESLLSSVCQSFVNLVLNILKNENLDKFSGKETGHIIKIISLLSQEMENNSKELISLQDSIEAICVEHSVQGSPNTAEELVLLLLNICERNKCNSTMLRTISKEIHYRIGDIEESVVLDGAGKYKLISESTSPAILISYCNFSSEVLSTIEIGLYRLNAIISTGRNYDENNADKMMCLKFVVLIQSFEEILQSVLPTVHVQDLVLKVVTKFYNVICQYVKYCLEYFRVKSGAQISSRFEKLIHCCGNMLKENAFKMITYFNNKQLENPGKRHTLIAAQAMKESRLIPALVFAIEQYEKHLILLSKKSKVDLFSGTKLTTSRDFRIKLDALQAATKRTAEEASDDDDDRISTEVVDADDNRSINSDRSSRKSNSPRQKKSKTVK